MSILNAFVFRSLQLKNLGLWMRTIAISVLIVLLCVADFTGSTAYARRGGDGGSEQKGRQDRLSGIVLDNANGGLGIWTILVDEKTQRLVDVNSTTRLDHGILPIGASVRVEGRVQANGMLVASRLRRDYLILGQIVIRLQPGVSPNVLATAYNLTIRSAVLASGNIYLFDTADLDVDVEALADQLMSDPQVIWAEPNFISSVPEGHPFRIWGWAGFDSAAYINQNAFVQVNLPPSTNPYQGAGIDVAVLDTGIDLNHPAFAGRLVPGFDVVADDAIPQDEGFGIAWGHGTHVSGIIAHVAPQSRIMPIRVLDTNGRGNTFLLAYAMELAARQGAEVINLSLGTNQNSKILADQVKLVTEQGVIVVAAAGNTNSNTMHFPAANPGAIGVTAVDAQNVKAGFANFGNGWVDLAAPGVGILSTFINGQGSGYASWSGTSMATPFVSGAAAMIRQQHPTASTAAIEKMLIDSGRSIDAQNPLYADSVGRLIDIQAALATTQLGRTTTVNGLTAAASGQSAERVAQLPEIYLPLVDR